MLGARTLFQTELFVAFCWLEPGWNLVSCLVEYLNRLPRRGCFGVARHRAAGDQLLWDRGKCAAVGTRVIKDTNRSRRVRGVLLGRRESTKGEQLE